MRELRQHLFEHLDQHDEVMLQQQLHELAEKQTQIDSITVRHFQHVRQLLERDQQEKFDSIIGEATHMMSGPPPPRREHGEDVDRHGDMDGPPPPDGRGPDDARPRERHPRESRP